MHTAARATPAMPTTSRFAGPPSQDVLITLEGRPCRRAQSSMARMTSAIPPDPRAGPTWIRTRSLAAYLEFTMGRILPIARATVIQPTDLGAENAPCGNASNARLLARRPAARPAERRYIIGQLLGRFLGQSVPVCA